MEELHSKPIPLPRSSPVVNYQQDVNGSGQIKKPVPLPRSPAVPMTSSSRATEDEKTNSESSSFEDVITKGYNTLTKKIKNKLKSTSDNVQGKSKSVIETTKSVGLKTERSVRGILQKRQSGSPVVNSNNEGDSAKNRTNRCQSLPSEDIFSSIKFGSPIQQEQSDYVYESDDGDTSLPPPEYPPPPLPDESLYDEVSTKSSHSGSHGDYYTCPSLVSSLPDIESVRGYEDVPDLKHLSLCGGSDSNSSQSGDIVFDMKSRNNLYEDDSGISHNLNSLQTPDDKRVTVSRSDSWNFYDSVNIFKKPMGEQYVNVTIQDSAMSQLRDTQKGEQYVNVTIQDSAMSQLRDTQKGEQYVNVTICESNQSARLSMPGDHSDKKVAIGDYKTTPLKPLQPVKVADDISDLNKNTSIQRQNSVLSSVGSDCSSVSIPNELYLNWQPVMMRGLNQDITSRASDQTKNNVFASKSFFSEFDPLYLAADNKPVDRSAKAESLPAIKTDENICEFVDDFDIVSLPVPPTRYDSITEETKEQPDIPNDVEYFLYHRPTTGHHVSNETLTVDSKENLAENYNATSTLENSPSESPEKEMFPEKRKSNLVRWTSMKRAIKKVAESSNWSPGVMRKSAKIKDGEEAAVTCNEASSGVVERPYINSSSGPLHSGFLFRSPSGGEKQKDFVQKWCQLSEGRLTYSTERTSSNKDFILIEHIYSIQIGRENKQSTEGEDIYCMEISCSLRDKPHLVGSPGTTERRIWMQKLLESLTLVFPPRLTADYTRAGWCYLKEGINGAWLAAWILLHKRTLFFSPCSGEIDLRKARSIVLQDGEDGCGRVIEKGPLMRIDSPNCAFYLQMNEQRETKAWCRAIQQAALNNGALLHEQQLTKDDMPTIIDKCINFVYAHGSMSEGIYRRNGSNTNVMKLLAAFQKDAWAVQITRNEYTEHDVASVLKRFFRDMSEPLLTTQLHKVLCNAAVLECNEEEKVSMYRSLLEQLPPVNYVTTRRLMGHLHHIHQQCERNLMPVENLAAIWGPTLMHVESGMDPNWSKKESQVVNDLISLYPRLFHVDGAELAREQRIQEVLERYHNSVQQTPHTTKPSGDIKVWVYIGSRDSDCVSVTVNPQREALDVCNELCPKMNVYGHELCLLESVLGGALLRPLHHTERVLDTVLRWGYWDDQDCRDNCLILVINTIIRDIQPLAKPPVAQCGELRFADLKSKTFKVYVFEFSQAKLCYYKDKLGSVKLGEWKIEDIVWYIGHEPKRNPHTRWSLTFINKNNRNKRSKDNPFFGYTIAGTTRDEQLRWMAAMLVGEFPHVDLLPKPQLNFLE
uniref:Arf-GAP with Rho-GAP domain, ANK repeat and PH domain-containing protein 2 n=1 Tax=Homalodisca liturata TaxID=320908 RepID=A0A1B6IHX6_9HEMI